MTYRQSETYSHKMPQKLTTTACFIQEESSGGKQFRKHVSCFYVFLACAKLHASKVGNWSVFVIVSFSVYF